MVDPVFVDTSEGRAVIADSLKPKTDGVSDNPDPVSKVEKSDEKKSKNKKDKLAGNNKDTNESIVQVQCEVETKRGLVAFSGLKHSNLFSKEEKTGPVTPNKAKPVPNSTEDSDSGSDYEYFKVNKELEAKKPKAEVKDEESQESESDPDPSPADTENIFQQAIKSAIVEDELILPASVNQTFLIVPMKLRLVTLCSLIVQHCVLNKKGGKMIVFMATLEMVDYHSELIETVLTGKNVKVKKKDQGKKAKAKKRKANDDSDDVSEY